MLAGWNARYFTFTLFLIAELSLALLSPKNTASAAGSPFSQYHSTRTDDMTGDPSIILSQEKVSQTIHFICGTKKSEARERLRKQHNLVLEVVQDWHQILAHVAANDSVHDMYLQNRTPWHFGISIHNADEREKLIGFVTFYVAYSSWSGRILYVDQIQLEDRRMNDDVETILLRLLAEIAVELNCARLTWRVRIKSI
jgi:hypothetical protein